MCQAVWEDPAVHCWLWLDALDCPLSKNMTCVLPKQSSYKEQQGWHRETIDREAEKGEDERNLELASEDEHPADLIVRGKQCVRPVFPCSSSWWTGHWTGDVRSEPPTG
jgi:hypothetical protein